MWYHKKVLTTALTPSSWIIHPCGPRQVLYPLWVSFALFAKRQSYDPWSLRSPQSRKCLCGPLQGIILTLTLGPLHQWKPMDHVKLPPQCWPLPWHPTDILKGPTYCLQVHFVTDKYQHYRHVPIRYETKNPFELKIKPCLINNYINVTNVFIFFKVLVDCSFIHHEKLRCFKVMFTWLCKRKTEVRS